MGVIFYTIGCPKCNVLEKKLNQNNVSFTKCTDNKTMIDKGFKDMPVLEVEGQSLSFSQAVQWINKQ